MNITVECTGTSPLLMHNPQLLDPEFEITKLMKGITSKRKKTEEDLRQLEKLEWYGGLYTMNGSTPPVLCQPSSKVRKCMIEAARIFKLGKQVERAVSFADVSVPLAYEGGKNIDKLFEDKKYWSRLPVVVGQKRIMRVRPQFFPWALKLKGFFLEDAGLNFSELQNIIETAGLAVGIGDNRVNGYGRFSGKVVK